MATQRGPDGSVRFAVQGGLAGVAWACVGWVQTGNSTTMSQVDLDNITTAWHNAFVTRFAPHMSSVVQISSTTSTGFYGGIHALHSTHVAASAGTAAGLQVQDNSCCLVVSWNTTVYWRGGKPRTYLPVPTAAQTQGGNQITPAEDTALTASAQGFHTDVGLFAIAGMVPITHGFVSFRSGNQARPTAVFFPITGANVHTRLGTQRRRLGRWVP